MDERIHERIMEKKIRIDSFRPLSNTVVSKLQKRLEIEYTYNSNAIEGNTLTLRETQLVIRQDLTVGGKSLSEHLEAKNHPKAIEYIESLAKQASIHKFLQESAVLKIHGLLFSGILENAGNYRNCQVFIEGCDHMLPPAYEIPELMSRGPEGARRPPPSKRFPEGNASEHGRSSGERRTLHRRHRASATASIKRWSPPSIFFLMRSATAA